MANEQGSGVEQWLAQLEERVAQAAAEIARLRQDNRRLEREVQRLKKAAGPGAEAGAGWERERAEVRRRVERLAQHLEGLLGADGEAAAAPTEASDERAGAAAQRPAVQRTLEPVE